MQSDTQMVFAYIDGQVTLGARGSLDLRQAWSVGSQRHTSAVNV